MVSTTAQHALRATMFLATHPDEAVAAHEVARATGLPPGYLPKVLRALAHAGILWSRRGPSGGYKLARAAENLRLIDVVSAVAGTGEAPKVRAIESAWPLTQRLNEYSALSAGALANCSIADLLRENGGHPAADPGAARVN